ncbi:hypothetical protein PO909_003506 [Leuciscus waleckii]
MVFAVPLRILLLCLLHFSTCAVGQDVNPEVLKSIVQRFQSSLASLGQYTVAFRVERNICLEDSDFPDQNLLDQVRQIIQNNGVYLSNNLIAAKADKDSHQHSEYRLKDHLSSIVNSYVGNIDKCVVYFTFNSPCLSKCLSDGRYNIKASLRRLQRYNGIKAFAFQNIFAWEGGSDDRNAVINRLKWIARSLPYYQCERNQAECKRL